jgi:hypothetical protein
MALYTSAEGNMDKDSPSVQKQRIINLAREVFHGVEIEFYEPFDPNTTDIRLRIRSIKTNSIVGSTKDLEWSASEISDWTDEKLKRKLSDLMRNPPSLRR